MAESDNDDRRIDTQRRSSPTSCEEGWLTGRKSRWRADSIDNLGGFQIIDPMRNTLVAGEKFNFTADDVVAFCAEYEARPVE